MISHVGRNTAKMMLRMISYKRDSHGLTSNCYKLLKINEFDEKKDLKFNLTIFCNHCGIELLVRKRCIKCHHEINKSIIENVFLKYLKYLWEQEIGGDRYCKSCGACEERRLKEYCRCGGKFIKRSYFDEIENIRKFVDTQKFNNAVESVKAYFN